MDGIARVWQFQVLQPFVIFARVRVSNGEMITLPIVQFAAAAISTGNQHTYPHNLEGDLKSRTWKPGIPRCAAAYLRLRPTRAWNYC